MMNSYRGYPSCNYVKRRNREAATPKPLPIDLALLLHINPLFT